MAVSLQDLYLNSPDVAQATPGTATSVSASAAEAEAPNAITSQDAVAGSVGSPDSYSAVNAEAVNAGNVSPFSSQDATASYAGTRDAAALAGSTRDASMSGSLASSTGYNAQTGEVDASMQSADQLNKITSQNSPLMLRAQKAGLLTAASRGLQNSSIAAGSAMGAMVDRATPLATQDAATNFQNSLENRAAVNRASEFTAGAANTAALTNAQLKAEAELQNASEANRMSGLNAQLGTQVSMSNADAYNKAQQLNAQLATAVSQGNAEAANQIRMQLAALEQQVNLQNAQAGTQVSLANSEAANRISMQIAELQSQAEQLNAQLQTAVSQGNQQEANRIQMQLQEIQAQTNQLNAQMQTAVNQQNAESATNVSLANAQMQTNVALTNAGFTNEMQQQILQANSELNRQWLAGEQSMDLATIQGRYQQLIAANESASQLYASYFQGISNIMANKDITPERVAGYVNVMQGMLEAGLRMIDTINNLDLTGGGGTSPAPGEDADVNPPGDSGGGTGTFNAGSETAGGGANLTSPADIQSYYGGLVAPDAPSTFAGDTGPAEGAATLSYEDAQTQIPETDRQGFWNNLTSSLGDFGAGLMPGGTPQFDSTAGTIGEVLKVLVAAGLSPIAGIAAAWKAYKAYKEQKAGIAEPTPTNPVEQPTTEGGGGGGYDFGYDFSAGGYSSGIGGSSFPDLNSMYDFSGSGGVNPSFVNLEGYGDNWGGSSSFPDLNSTYSGGGTTTNASSGGGRLWEWVKQLVK